MKAVLSFGLEVPFWCSFRDPAGVNVHLTYRLPPLTTLYGLLANALGMAQDDYSLRPHLSLAVAIERAGELVETYSKILKINGHNMPPGYTFISTTVIKQKLIRPAFQAYVLAEQDVIETLASRLKNPARPLYLGESDDVVDVHSIFTSNKLELQTMTFIDCAVPGIHPESTIANLPVMFTGDSGKWGVKRRLYSFRIPQGLKDTCRMKLATPIPTYRIADRYIVFEPEASDDLG